MKLLFKNVINKAIDREATDVHFIPSEQEVYIKFRIQDNLILQDTIQLELYKKLLTYMKYQAGLDVSNHNTAQSGRYIYKMKQLFYLRISTLPLSLGNESCVIRIIPQYFQKQSHGSSIKSLYSLMNKKQGLILFSGPTGSGKSTLMYHMVMYAKEQLDLNIITVEDPVEQLIKGVTQVSINEKAGINYETSFKAILRCDPDVILIGEIRDASIAKYVIQASLSGHLVLSTIHANDCKGALLRLREMNISVQEICQSIKSIINQRLVTTLQHNRQLIYEQLNQQDINYFFENNHSLPKDFNKLSYYLNGMSRAGVICEETVDRYI
ncbi:competence type IV pilus ATPase ComGA [Staphylococcus succinus]|uniref:competence type IV pilus ATPase ComGA n=1 Tax=Staphylococcus succinus TaxID=61015 RepID=UPI00062BD9F3|nr:competence type IV pilus ATPase ComGA [Staphylococcus succinus]MDH9159976.1 competence type IV pilus ATPase ComGA [Staphylococcus succinus]PNZ15273.1 competence protein ComGA [Staphylococcus succinus subsp. succinus]RIN39540.1 type II/IV secretion system protein [Staphylococcus succinus]